MAQQLTVTRTARGGWTVTAGGLTYEIEGAREDRGDIRAAVTVRHQNSIVDCDKVNLSSAQSRDRLTKALVGRGHHVDDGPLVALGEAIRQQPSGGRGRGVAAPPTFRESPPKLDLAGLVAAFRNGC
jgi:hypothetical protein